MQEKFLPKIQEDFESLFASEGKGKEKNGPAILSDHAYLRQYIHPDHQLLSWNLTTQRANEDEDAYKERIKLIAEKLADQLVKNPNLSVVTLQEVPVQGPLAVYALNAIQNALVERDPDHKGLYNDWKVALDNLVRLSSKNPSEPLVGSIILSNRNKVKSTKAEVGFIPSQDGAVLAADFVAKAGEKFRVASVNFPESILSTFEIPNVQVDVDKILASTEQQVIIAGTFAYDLKKLSEKEGNADPKYKFSNANTFYTRSKLGEIEGYNTDGFVFKRDPASLSAGVDANSTKPINFEKLEQYFKDKNYPFSKSNNKTEIKVPTDEGKTESIHINQVDPNNVQFRTTSSNETVLNELAAAVGLCVDKNVALSINVKGGTKEQREEAGNRLWLKAVLQGYKVNYVPTTSFLAKDDVKSALEVNRESLHFSVEEKYLSPKTPGMGI